jgi:hypothetical protein
MVKLMNDEYERIWRELDVAFFFKKGLRKAMRISVRVAGVPAENGTDHLQNTSLEPYH